MGELNDPVIVPIRYKLGGGRMRGVRFERTNSYENRP